MTDKPELTIRKHTPGILRHPRPKLADISCSKMQFAPGDRIFVKLYRDWDIEYEKKLRRSIQKFAGCEVEVFIYDGRIMEIEVERPVIQRGLERG